MASKSQTQNDSQDDNNEFQDGFAESKCDQAGNYTACKGKKGNKDKKEQSLQTDDTDQPLPPASSTSTGREGVPHFATFLGRERKEPLILKASICDLLDHAILESPECIIELNNSIIHKSVSRIKISDCYGPGWEGLDKSGSKNPLNMGHISENHNKNEKESTYGFGTKRSLMKLVNRAVIYTYCDFDGKMQYIKIEIDFGEMCCKSAIESYDTKKSIITFNEYKTHHPYELGSTIILSDFEPDELRKIDVEHFRYIIREHYPTRLSKIKFKINGDIKQLTPAILSKVNFDNYDENDGMYKKNVKIIIRLLKTNEKVFKLCCNFNIGGQKTITYDTKNIKMVPHWGGSVTRTEKAAISAYNDFTSKDDDLYIKKELVLSVYYYGECNAITDIRPARKYINFNSDEAIKKQAAPHWELQHFSRQTSISHNRRHYNYIPTWKIGDNHGLYTVGYINYEDKVFTRLFGLDSQKNCQSQYVQLPLFCKALGGVQEKVQQGIVTERQRIKKEVQIRKKKEEKELREQELKEKELKDKQDKEKELREQELKERELREKELKEKELKDKQDKEEKHELKEKEEKHELKDKEEKHELKDKEEKHEAQKKKDYINTPTWCKGETKEIDDTLSATQEVNKELSKLVLNITEVSSYKKTTFMPLNEPTFYNMLEELVKSDDFNKLKKNANTDKIVDKSWVAMIETWREGIQELKSQEIETNH